MSAGEHHAALTDKGLVLLRELFDEFVRAGELRRVADLLHRRTGLAVADIVRHRPGEEVHVLLDDADRPAQGREIERTDILSVEGDLARGKIIEAGDQAAHRGLAAARGTDDRHVFARPDRQIEVLEHIALLFIVAERHVGKDDLALYVAEVGEGPVIARLRLDRHHLGEALDAGHALFKLLGELHDALDRGDQHRDIEEVRRVIGGRDLLFHHEHTAEEEHHHIHQPVEKAHHRVEPRHIAVGVPLDAGEPCALGVELGALLCFAGKRFDHADAQKGVFGLRVNVARDLAPRFEHRPHLAAEIHRAEEHERQQHERRRGQRQVDRAKEAEADADLDPEDEELLRTVVRELRDIKEVRRDPRHQLADLGVVVVAERDAQQVGEQVLAHIAFDHHAHRVSDIDHIIARADVHELQRPVDRGEGQHQLQRKP